MALNSMYILGIECIDSDHITIFENIEKLEAAIKLKEPKQMSVAASALYYSVYQHLSREEDLIKEWEGFAEHKKHHEKLLEDLDSVFEATTVVSDTAAAFISLTAFINAWLKGHILGCDANYVPFLKAQQDL